jgi:hypothetical protein
VLEKERKLGTQMHSRKSEHETKSRQQGTAIEATTCIALSKKAKKSRQ